MTFRPSDDVLDEINSDKQVSSANYNIGDSSNTGDGGNMFNKTSDFDGQITVPDEIANIINNAAEDVKAPDLSDLLGGNGNVDSDNKLNSSTGDMGAVANIVEDVESDNNADVDKKVDSSIVTAEISGSMPDEERFKIVSGIDGAQHSNLDFLVDNQWKEVVDKYRKIYRIVARWGIFICITIVGVLCGVVAQVNAKESSSLKMITDADIIGNNDIYENTNESILSEVGDNLNTLVPYGSASIDGNDLQSRSNLILYKGIVLPQLVLLNYKSQDLLSLDDFDNGEVSRSDLENLVKYLITNDSIYRRTVNLPNPIDSRWQGQLFLDGGLIEGFNLSCLGAHKVSDFVCKKFLFNFYEYGRYYNLSRYSSDVLDLVNVLDSQNEDLKPVCEMIKEYTLRSGVISSENLYSAMSHCDKEDFEYYKKMLNFIDVDNSLSQPELPSKIFDDRDMNAYKLMSAWQSLYRILNGTSINENFISSYLVFVQNLINKDKKSGNYLSQIYKDLLYVFNTDVLYQKLLDKGALSNDIKTKIDMINNGELYRDNISLVKQLKTADIVKVNESFSGANIKEITLDELSSRLYSMKDNLKIRKITKISDTELRVQTEIFSDKILDVTAGESLKAIINLYRLYDILYVDNIKITNQSDFSEILSAYAWNQPVTLQEMIAYIDEQVTTWYNVEGKEEDVELGLCDELSGDEAIVLYKCDDSSISLYKGDIEYSFQLLDGALQSFKIGDEDLDSAVNEKLHSVMITRNNTDTIIKSIVDFELDKEEVMDNVEKKLRIIDQFRIHLMLEPDEITDIEGESDVFLVNFTLGEFDLQARYNVETHLMTRISYVACDKILEIRNLKINVSTDNKAELTEILNNPRAFFTQANQAAYKRYQTLCDG